jgi:glutaminyl-peptide cyclotransferase
MGVAGYRAPRLFELIVRALLLAAVAIGCGGAAAPSGSPAAVEPLRVEVVERRPHYAASYTEGLVLVDGRLYESTGLYGESTLREIDPQSGAVLRSVALDPRYFGEGIAIVDDHLIQLTWQERTALVYNLSDLGQVGAFSYDTEGWGLCYDGDRLVMSSGTSRLQFRDRATFALLGSVEVTNAGEPVEDLNELECVDGNVYANVNQTATIVRIDPTNGQVTAVIDGSALFAEAAAAGGGVMNGIAYDASTSTFLLTGKHWSTLFDVRLVLGNVVGYRPS